MKRWDLSKTERLVYAQLSLGLSNKQVAINLDTSIRALKFHITNIYKKMNVKTREQFIVKALNLREVYPSSDLLPAKKGVE